MAVNQTQLSDVIIVGGGHAGIEAALAAARLGCRVVLFTMSIDTIGLMPCNPSIGGPAKGQMVGEIDALGGEMGRCADHTFIQLKVLNRSRGPAVQCLRSQNDKLEYAAYMKKKVTTHPLITVIESEVYGLLIENKTIHGIITQDGTSYTSSTVVLTTGTFLKARMHTGLTNISGGRVNEGSAEPLSDCLYRHFRLGRLKTGTPPRLHRDSIDYSELKPQPGDPEFLKFSFRTRYNDRYKNQSLCHLTYTTPDAHRIILDNLDQSPLYTKVIKGVGPRYCPSIEDKVVRFSDKESHHIFIEPEGRDSIEMYPQGLNTSLPEFVQDLFLRTMPGLKDVKIIRPGYAVDYDFVFPDQLQPTLETRAISGLFLAGQINGTSGYEEAAGQGLIAGINAGLFAQKRAPFILTRENSFIGTMIDDLIHKNIYEPYRMLTSRSEYRLLLRQDNAPFRLSHYAADLGLITSDEFQKIQDEQSKIEQYRKIWAKTSCSPTLMTTLNLKQKCPLTQLIKRPEISEQDIMIELSATEQDRESIRKAMVMIKYDGYIKKQEDDIKKIQSLANKRLPTTIDFDKIPGLRMESREKFKQYAPKTIYDAQHIAGINPADIFVLVTFIEKYGIHATSHEK